jgi:phosphoglycolate phosphatase
MLWDIDHTLINVQGVSQEAYALAFEAVFGRPLARVADMSGRTELAIAADTLELNGLDPGVDLAPFFTALGNAAYKLRDRMRAEGLLLPGVPDALRRFAAAGVTQSVVTGNLPSLAGTKLAAFDLLEHLDLAVGGFGDEGIDRAQLVRLAIGRANAEYGLGFTAARTAVIGDTPRDIQGALDSGSIPIGVATGRSSVADLEAAGARLVLPDLSDVTALLELVMGAG